VRLDPLDYKLSLYDPVSNTLNGRIWGNAFIVSDDPIVIDFNNVGYFEYSNPSNIPMTK
jgi:hypothetical protein